jgi:hypothetical protein
MNLQNLISNLVDKVKKQSSDYYFRDEDREIYYRLVKKGRQQGLKEASEFFAALSGSDCSDINKVLKNKHVKAYLKELE